MLRLDRGIRKIGNSGKEITRSSRVMTERDVGNDKGEKAGAMTLRVQVIMLRAGEKK
jgi:hypothetical protein